MDALVSEALDAVVDGAQNGKESRAVSAVLVDLDQAVTDLSKQIAAVKKDLAALKKSES